MAIIKQEITSKGTIDTYFARVGTWNRFHNEGQTNYRLGFGVLYQEDLKDNDILEITIKTPIDGTFSDGMWISVWKSNDVNIEPSFSVNWSPTANTFNEEQKAEWTKLLEKIKTASPTNPVRFAIKIGTVVITPPKITYGNIVILDDGLYIDYKKVKALNADGKNFKQFAIDGHIYDFRRANLPADEQTELQVLIDGYDWTHLSATGKALAANSLTWDQISGEPAIHAGVTVTGITHPAIDADGTLVATISFSRHLSDGTTDLATKQVNIAFVLIKAAPLAVWYSCDSPNHIYKDGVPTYVNESFYLTCDKDGNLYSYNGNGIWKNGTKIYNNAPNVERSISLDKDANLYFGDGNGQIWKNGVKINGYKSQQQNYGLCVSKNGDVFYMDGWGSIYKNDQKLKTEVGLSKFVIDSSGNYYYNGRNGSICKNGDPLYDSRVFGSINHMSIGKNDELFIFGDKKLFKGNKVIIELGFDINIFSIDSQTGDVWFMTQDKKVMYSKLTGTTYSKPIVKYTVPGYSDHILCTTEYGSRTGIWD